MSTMKTLITVLTKVYDDYLPFKEREGCKSLANVTKPVIIDFLSQKFTAAMLRDSRDPMIVAALERLFQEITKESKDE